MRAVDTNIVVRFLARDDEDQYQRVARVFDDGDLLLLTTVVLEAEWVLRNGLRFDRARVVAGLQQLVGHEGVHLEEPVRVIRALELSEQGIDFADALHLAGSTGCAEFITFDRPLVRRAATQETVAVVEP